MKPIYKANNTKKKDYFLKDIICEIDLAFWSHCHKERVCEMETRQKTVQAMMMQQQMSKKKTTIIVAMPTPGGENCNYALKKQLSDKHLGQEIYKRTRSIAIQGEKGHLHPQFKTAKQKIKWVF